MLNIDLMICKYEYQLEYEMLSFTEYKEIESNLIKLKKVLGYE